MAMYHSRVKLSVIFAGKWETEGKDRVYAQKNGKNEVKYDNDEANSRILGANMIVKTEDGDSARVRE